MALTDKERDQIINRLDQIDEVAKKIILASLEAFTEWLSSVLHKIYIKIKDTITEIWNWICKNFLK